MKSTLLLVFLFIALAAYYTAKPNNELLSAQPIAAQAVSNSHADDHLSEQHGKSSVEVRFSPNGGATQSVVELIGEARRYVHVAAYDFTSRDIAQALIDANRRGIDVQAVLDKENKEAHYTTATFLANERIPTRIDSRYSIMHNKFMVIDGVTVETGSFNYTVAAERHNAENVLILRNDPNVAWQYKRRWPQLWAESTDYVPNY